jgi:hypothetical protein
MRPFASIVTALIPRNSTIYPPCPWMETLISTFFHYSPSIATIGTQENPVKHDAQAKILLFQRVAEKIERARGRWKNNPRKSKALRGSLQEKTR